MPLFLIEREFADRFDPSDDAIRAVDEYEHASDIRWLTSFLSSDKRKSYCLYEAADAETMRRHAADLGLPLDAIVEVSEFER
jgi:hypothetical protein